MNLYFDTSAIVKLYHTEPESEKLSEWIGENRIVIPVSLFHSLEIHNAFALKVFRGEITDEQYEKLRECLAVDRISGVIKELCADWNQVFQKAAEIARIHTPDHGNRSLDILHIALAMETGYKKIITFDIRQSELAIANGLEVITLQNMQSKQNRPDI